MIVKASDWVCELQRVREPRRQEKKEREKL